MLLNLERSTKTRILIFIILLFVVLATPFFLARKEKPSVIRALGDGTCRLQKLSLDRLARYLPFGPTFSSKRYLSNAERKLTEIARIRTENFSLEKCLVQEYIDNIDRAFEELRKIKSEESANSFFADTFKRLASHQVVLRGLKQRSSQPLSVVDAARGANLRVQRKLIDHVSNGIDKTEEKVKTNTERLLACPDCNVIIISLTTLRKNNVGLYGYDRPTTPNIDAFFEKSLVFNNAIAPTSWTIPNAVSLFTSLFPYTHGITARDYLPQPVFYNEKISTFAELLSGQGYRTAAFTGGGDYNRQFSGIDRGFDYYLDELTFEDHTIGGDLTLGGPNTRLLYAKLQDVLDPAMQWLEQNKGEKFFFFLQGYDIHCPLYPREPYASQFTAGLEKSFIDFSVCYWTYQDTAPEYEQGKAFWRAQVPAGTKNADGNARFSESDIEYMKALYDARIAETDDLLGKLFTRIESLNLEKNTIIVFMSDHGEMLGENGWFMRGESLRGSSYDLVLNIPLLIKHPAIETPVMINDPVQMVDIMPTLVQMLDITDPLEHIREGTSLEFQAFGDIPTNEFAYAGATYFPKATNTFFNKANATAAVRDTDWKLVKNTVFEEYGLISEDVSYKLYNIAIDPFETNDVSSANPEIAADLRKKLEQWLNQYLTLPEG